MYWRRQGRHMVPVMDDEKQELAEDARKEKKLAMRRAMALKRAGKKPSSTIVRLSSGFILRRMA